MKLVLQELLDQRVRPVLLAQLAQLVRSVLLVLLALQVPWVKLVRKATLVSTGAIGDTGPTGPTLAIAGVGTGTILLTDGSNNVYTNPIVRVYEGPTGTVEISGNIIPSADNVFTLGLPDKRWNHLYVGPGSITIGDAVASADASGNLLLNKGLKATALALYGNVAAGDVYLSATGPTGPAGLTGPNLHINGNILPTESNTYSLGATGASWKEIYIGPGSINIAGPVGSANPATIGSDLQGIVYTEGGFATPFINIGPAIETTQAVGGWKIFGTGPTGPGFQAPTDLLAQINTPSGPTGPVYSLLGRTGATGPTGAQGQAGQNGTSGLTLFFDSSGSAAPDLSATLLTTPNLGTQTSVTYSYGNNDNAYHLLGSFITPQNALTNPVITSGIWDTNMYMSLNQTGSENTMYIKIYYVDSNGTSNKTLIKDGSTDVTAFKATSVNGIVLVENSLYVASQTLPDITKRIIIEVYVAQLTGNTNSHTITAYFRDTKQSHIHTGLVAIAVGATGPTGPTLPIQGPGTGTILLTDGANNVYTNSIVRVYQGPTGTVEISGNIIPSVDNLYTLGLPNKRWNHLYVGPGSITIGDANLTADASGRLVSDTGFKASYIEIPGVDNSGNYRLTVDGSNNLLIQNVNPITEQPSKSYTLVNSEGIAGANRPNRFSRHDRSDWTNWLSRFHWLDGCDRPHRSPWNRPNRPNRCYGPNGLYYIPSTKSYTYYSSNERIYTYYK